MSLFPYDACVRKRSDIKKMGKKTGMRGEKNSRSIDGDGGGGISRESKGLADKSANIEYPESFVFLLLRSSGAGGKEGEKG